MKGWYGDKHRHSMASRGIITKANGNWKDKNINKIENILSEKATFINNLPFGEEIDIRDINKYRRWGWKYQVGQYEDGYGITHGIDVTPAFSSKEELDAWWNQNKYVIEEIFKEAVDEHNIDYFHKHNTSPYYEDIKDYSEIKTDNLFYFDEYGMGYTDMGENLEKMLRPVLKNFVEDELYVNVYMADRGYGGAEEGGWWYDIEDPISVVRVRNEKDAREWKEKLLKKYPYTGKRGSVMGGDDYNVRIQGFIGEYSPVHKPMYN